MKIKKESRIVDIISSVYWIALCIYHEARGEPAEGQIAVAQVILNRVEERGLTARQVIFQPKQFSWTDDKYADSVTDHNAFAEALRNTVICLERRLNGDTFQGANLYHSNAVSPSWSTRSTYIELIGGHRFYREKR